MKPKAIDLFSGCGGLTLGLRQAGFQVIGAVEIDPVAVETYKSNHKRVHVWTKDICDLTIEEIRKRFNLRPGELDLVAGCPPCQGFSTMTTLNGRYDRNDDRNNLVFQYLRIIQGLRPKAVMMENVPDLLKDGRSATLKRELEALGYVCKMDVLDTSKYGVPQRRRRFVLVAGHGQAIEFAKEVKGRRTVQQAFAKLRRPKTDVLHNLAYRPSPAVLERIKLTPKDGGSRGDLGQEYQLACHKKSDGFKDVYGRMAWNKPAPTITGGCFNPSKGRFLHPEENRPISMREAALLQSFPPDYRFSLMRGKTGVAQMIGNALPPEFIRRHASIITEFLRR